MRRGSTAAMLSDMAARSSPASSPLSKRRCSARATLQRGARRGVLLRGLHGLHLDRTGSFDPRTNFRDKIGALYPVLVLKGKAVPHRSAFVARAGRRRRVPWDRTTVAMVVVLILIVVGGGGGDFATPAPAADAPPGFAEIDVGLNHTCAITTAAGLKCWGLNSSGQLGTGDFIDRSVPKNVVALGFGGVTQVSAGGAHTCAVAVNRVRCWGDNTWGQLCNSTSRSGTANPYPLLRSESLVVTQVSAGHDHTCVLTEDTEVWCWGLNNYGQVGNNTSGNAWLGPTPVCESGTGFTCEGGQRLSG